MKLLRRSILLAVFALTLGTAHAQTWLEPGDRFVHRDGASDDEAFVRGKLGVILPSYGRASLYAAYRVLMLPPGTLASESHERLESARRDKLEAKSIWLQARAAVRQDAPRAIDYYKNFGNGLEGVFGNCGASAFETAAKTLQDLHGNPAVKPADLQAWIDGQDAVFDQCAWSPDKGDPPALPAALPAGASPLLNGLRNYQHAAALFYRGDFDTARKEFDAIAADTANPMRALAALASLRCTIREASLNPAWDLAFRHAYFDQGLRGPALRTELDRPRTQRRERDEQAQLRVEARAAVLVKDPAFASVAPFIQQLVRNSDEQLTPWRAIGPLFEQLDHLDRNPYPEDTLHRWDRLLPTTSEFVPGTAQADAARRAHPFYDWQMTIQGCDDDPLTAAPAARCDAEHAHALAHWQAKAESAWLLAALATTRHPTEAEQRLVAAARDVPDSDPAWVSLQYHAARVLRLMGQRDEARAVVDRALAHAGLDASASNLFHQERFALATSVAGAMPDALRNPGGRLPVPTVAADGGMLFDDRLASDDLLALARDDKTPAPLRASLAAAAWYRADISQRFDVAVPAAALTGELVPGLAPTARRYAAATSPDDRRDAVVQATLAIQFSPKVRHDERFQPGAPIARGRSPGADWCAFGGQREKLQQAVERVPALAPELRGSSAQAAEFTRLQAAGDGPAWFDREAIAAARRHPGEPMSVALLKAVIASTKNASQLCPAIDAPALRAAAEQLLANPAATVDLRR